MFLETEAPAKIFFPKSPAGSMHKDDSQEKQVGEGK